MTEEGNWFDRYRLIQPIGQGGMGSVYLAEDKQRNNRKVVVKQIKNESKVLAEQAEMIKVFQREVAFLSRLNHRGIVKCLDEHFSADGMMFLVMDYVPGANLESVVNREGALSTETVCRIGIQCTDVLEYLHGFEPPIIYRDLKPSNLMLRPDGLIVFIDFGIARDFEPKGPATRVVTSGYSPPEQYFGRPEPRGDLYSLGATMHHLLTGVRPKPMTSCQPRSLNTAVTPSMDLLIRQLTDHDIDKRPPSARYTQYELFKIYQELHPDFIIPDLGVDESDFEDEDLEDYDDEDNEGDDDEDDDYDDDEDQEYERNSQRRASTGKGDRSGVNRSASRVSARRPAAGMATDKESLLDKLKNWIKPGDN